MGAWGPEPKDNDDTLDYMVHLSREIAPVVDRFLKKTVPYSLRGDAMLWGKLGVLQLFVESNTILYESSIRWGLDTIDLLRADEVWLNRWKNKRAILDSMRRFERVLSGRR